MVVGELVFCCIVPLLNVEANVEAPEVRVEEGQVKGLTMKSYCFTPNCQNRNE